MTALLQLWADMEDPLDEEPLFHIDARDKDPKSEDDRQAEFKKMIKRSPGMQITAVLNDHKWGLKGLNRARKLGAWWGFPDTIVLAETRLLVVPVAMLEFKNGYKMPEPHQVRCLNTLHRMGFHVGVFRRADSAAEWLRARGFPVRERAA